MKLSLDQQRLLWVGLHSKEGAAARWAGCRSLDDGDLRRRVAGEFGIMGGYGRTGERIEYRGGANPRAVIQIGDDPPLILEGRQLLSAVRQLLGISRPDELF